MDNSKKLKLLSLCTGYGGIERGLEIAGVDFRTVSHVEIEAFACANLVAKMEEGEMDSAPIWTDLKTLPLDPFRGSIDILTGGYPCQPFSAAGRRLGKDDPRHLWPWICRIIDGIMPRMCFFENVEGHVTLGLRQVLADLEARGYKTSWGIFSASEVGASHQRKRVFILAHSIGKRGREIQRQQRKSINDEFERTCQERRIEELSYSNNERLQGALHEIEEGENRWGPGGSIARFPSPPSKPQHEWEEPRTLKPELGRTANGTNHRVDRLRLLGNGVVPQTAAKAWITLNKEQN